MASAAGDETVRVVEGLVEDTLKMLLDMKCRYPPCDELLFPKKYTKLTAKRTEEVEVDPEVYTYERKSNKEKMESEIGEAYDETILDAFDGLRKSKRFCIDDYVQATQGFAHVEVVDTVSSYVAYLKSLQLMDPIDPDILPEWSQVRRSLYQDYPRPIHSSQVRKMKAKRPLELQQNYFTSRVNSNYSFRRISKRRKTYQYEGFSESSEGDDGAEDANDGHFTPY